MQLRRINFNYKDLVVSRIKINRHQKMMGFINIRVFFYQKVSRYIRYFLPIE